MKIKKINRKKLLAIIALLILGGVTTFRVWHVYNLEPTPFDLYIQKLFFSLRTPFVSKIVIYITHLADTKNIIFMCILLLILPTRGKYGLPVTLASATAVLAYVPLKNYFMRPRPDEALRLITQTGGSLPSGHSAISIVFFGLLLIMVRRYVRDDETRDLLIAILGFFSIAIGLSRIYVGVHWPTDVIVGWCIGGIIVLITSMITNPKGLRGGKR